MPTRRVQNLLQERGAEYARIEHEPAYTAQQEAAAAHVPGREWVKTVVFFRDDEPALALVPATHRVDIERLSTAAGARSARFASEEEIAELFPDCERGAVPPFGSLWGLPVFCDAALRLREQVAFHAGSHREALQMKYSEFERLAEPVVAEFSERGELVR
jgi:Ala-tRNA(Pro) deacylase